ncbi:MAG: response regulator [Pseudomonadales bacterium]|nr:response regulator [Pseudomonadales bacterium]MCP5184939.1 response regulator [Pseudomonadales bacterium]
MIWILLSALSALAVLLSAVVVTTRWAPPSLWWYPQMLIGASVLYMTASILYLVSDELSVQQAMVRAVHIAFGLSVVNCLWLLLRVMTLHGRAVPASRWLTHALPGGVLAVTLVLAYLPSTARFVSLTGSHDFELHPAWIVYAFELVLLCLVTVVTGIHSAVAAKSQGERTQYLVIVSAMVLPIGCGLLTSSEVSPVHLMNLGYGVASGILIIAVAKGWMDEGLGSSLGALLESDPYPRLFINSSMRLIYRNPTAVAMFPEAQELGSDVRQWLPGKLTTSVGRTLGQKVFERLVNDEADDRARPLLFRVGDDRTRWYAIEVRRVQTGSSVSGTVLSLRDETMLERYREAAISARQVHSLRRLSSSIAHRFNNLMVSVVGNVDLAQYEVENEPLDHQKVRNILADIKSAGEQASELAVRFGYFGEEGDQVGPAEATFDLNDLVRDALLIVEPQLPRGITLDVGLAIGAMPVEISPARVSDMVIDLVMNSVEAYGGEAGTIQVSTGRRRVGPNDLPELMNRDGLAEGDVVWLKVSDHAGGMTVTREEGLFEPFVTTKEGRQGLGLSAVLSTASLNQGAVDARNIDGGAAVVVYLPRSGDAIAGAAGGGITVEPLERDTVLLVDDDEAVLQVHAAMLSSLGQNVFPTASPEAALQRAAMHRFKAAIIDVSMPLMSGQELASRLRLRDPSLPVLFISGYVHEPLRIDPRDPSTAFLAKPFGMEQLFLELERISRPPQETGKVIRMPGLFRDT